MIYQGLYIDCLAFGPHLIAHAALHLTCLAWLDLLRCLRSPHLLLLGCLQCSVLSSATCIRRLPLPHLPFTSPSRCNVMDHIYLPPHTYTHFSWEAQLVVKIFTVSPSATIPLAPTSILPFHRQAVGWREPVASGSEPCMTTVGQRHTPCPHKKQKSLWFTHHSFPQKHPRRHNTAIHCCCSSFITAAHLAPQPLLYTGP